MNPSTMFEAQLSSERTILKASAGVERLPDVLRVAHRLKGSAPMFGFASLGEVARGVYGTLRGWGFTRDRPGVAASEEAAEQARARLLDAVEAALRSRRP